MCFDRAHKEGQILKKKLCIFDIFLFYDVHNKFVELINGKKNLNDLLLKCREDM